MKYKTFRALVVGTALLGAAGGVAALAFSCRGEEKPSARQDAPVAARSAPLAPSEVPGVKGREGPLSQAAPGEGGALRPMDREILERARQPIPGAKVKDALPGRPFKVNLYRDDGHAKVNRLKIDLDRDDKWDEKWTLSEEGGREEVKRQVAPADDENYSAEYRLRADAWARK